MIPTRSKTLALSRIARRLPWHQRPARGAQNRKKTVSNIRQVEGRGSRSES